MSEIYAKRPTLNCLKTPKNEPNKCKITFCAKCENWWLESKIANFNSYYFGHLKMIFWFSRLYPTWCGTHSRHGMWSEDFEQKGELWRCLQSQLSFPLSNQRCLPIFHLWDARRAEFGTGPIDLWKIQYPHDFWAGLFRFMRGRISQSLHEGSGGGAPLWRTRLRVLRAEHPAHC